MTQWILLADQKPADMERVIITVDGVKPHVTTAVYHAKAGLPFFWGNSRQFRNVTYWMPWPEPATIPQK